LKLNDRLFLRRVHIGMRATDPERGIETEETYGTKAQDDRMRATDPERGIETSILRAGASALSSMRATDPERGIETGNIVASGTTNSRYEGHRSRTGD